MSRPTPLRNGPHSNCARPSPLIRFRGHRVGAKPTWGTGDWLHPARVLGPYHRVRGSFAVSARAAKYYHKSRTHLSLAKDAPKARPVQGPEGGRIVAIPQLGDLHHATNGGRPGLRSRRNPTPGLSRVRSLRIQQPHPVACRPRRSLMFKPQHDHRSGLPGLLLRRHPRKGVNATVTRHRYWFAGTKTGYDTSHLPPAQRRTLISQGVYHKVLEKELTGKCILQKAFEITSKSSWPLHSKQRPRNMATSLGAPEFPARFSRVALPPLRKSWSG